MKLTQIIFISMLLTAIIMVLMLIKGKKGGFNKKTSLLPLTTFTLIIFNWLLYLFGFYAVLPVHIGDAVFLPIRYLLCIAGLVIAFKEYKKNRILAILNGGISIITSIFGILLIVISHTG